MSAHRPVSGTHARTALPPERRFDGLRRPLSPTWYLGKKSYTLFMVRELTSVFIAGYAIFLMVMVARAAQGPAAFTAFYETLKSPLSIALHLIALAMALYHVVTWFSLLPRVMVIWRGEEKLPGNLLIGANWGAWVAVSIVVALLALGGR